MRRHWQGVIAAALVAALLIGSGVITMVFAAGNTTPDVSYHLYVTDYADQDGGTTTTKMTMELYVYYANGTNKYVKRGSFGLRFPESIAVEDVVFTPDSENIELFPFYTGTGATYDEWKRPGQHAFLWNVLPKYKEENVRATDPGEATAFGELVATQGMSGGIRMHVGTYTITLRDDFPAGNSIGQLDWLTTTLSADSMYTEGDGAISKEIWNDTDGDGAIAYQGHYQDPDSADGLSMSQVDMPLVFTAPDYWPIVGLTVLSYDPKKNIELTLTDLSGNVVANGFTAPTWSSEDTNMVYAATVDNADSGIGPYYTAINLDKYTLADGVTALSPGGYILEIRKEGHLLQTLPLALTGTSLNEAEGLPEDGGYIYLPAGDINYVETQDSVDLFGDGRIDMSDRSVVMGLLGKAVSASSGAAYLADVDGDKRVTQADLSILVSPQNYGKYIN